MNKKIVFSQFVVSIVVIILCFLYFRFGIKAPLNNGGNTTDKDTAQTAIIADSTSNVLPTQKVNSVLDELLKQKQKLVTRFFEEVSGKNGKAGVGEKAMEIQKEIEKTQLQIDVIQKAMGIVETKKDTIQN